MTREDVEVLVTLFGVVCASIAFGLWFNSVSAGLFMFFGIWVAFSFRH